MSTSFVHSPGFRSGGIDVETWLSRYWNPDTWKSDSGLTFDGTVRLTVDGKECPFNEACVVFRDFKQVLGAAGAYHAKPVGIYRFDDALRCMMGRSLPGCDIRDSDVGIPLGIPAWSKENTKTVLQQCARQWVTGGQNLGDMKTDDVLVMYYGALQNLVYESSNAKDAAQQKWLNTALAYLTRAFAVLHRDEPLFQKVTTAMVLTPGVEDMLQKALAHVFHPQAKWDKETILGMLEITIRRNLRHKTEMVGMSPGPFAVFLMAPLLRSIAMDLTTGVDPDSAITARFNKRMTDLLEAFVGVASSDAEAMKVNTLAKLVTVVGVPLTTAQAAELLTFCRTTPDMSARFDWVAAGVLPAPPALEPAVTTKRFGVAGHAGASFAAIVRPATTTSFTVFGFKGVEWSGVQFGTPGIYRIVAHDLGIAEAREGNTRGKELVANWRVTCGEDILPRDLAGYSSAGMEHCVGTDYVRPRYGGEPRLVAKWHYSQKTAVPFGTEFFLEITAETVTLRGTGGRPTYFSMKRDGLPVLLGFKNLWLDVAFKPLPAAAPAPVVAPQPVRAGFSYAAAARGPSAVEKADLDLPPAALIAKLREAALGK